LVAELTMPTETSGFGEIANHLSLPPQVEIEDRAKRQRVITMKSMHWYEGLFICPQHFQRAERDRLEWDRVAGQLDHPDGWGIARMDIDTIALAKGKVVVSTLLGRLPGGMLLGFGKEWGDRPLILESKAAVNETAFIIICVPGLRLGRISAVVDGEAKAREARYVVDCVANLADENDPQNLCQEPVQIRRLNLELREFSDCTWRTTLDEYDFMPLMKVRRQAGGLLEIDESFVPPVLFFDSSAALKNRLNDTCLQIRNAVNQIMSQIQDRSIEARHVESVPLVLAQFAILSGCLSRLEAIVGYGKIHPRQLFIELCGCAGQLAALGAKVEAVTIPDYDHDKLAGCLLVILNKIDLLIQGVQPHKVVSDSSKPPTSG
jgi:type VI secretion system protein ImpJ